LQLGQPAGNCALKGVAARTGRVAGNDVRSATSKRSSNVIECDERRLNPISLNIAMDRYERRARSRRKLAIQEMDDVRRRGAA